MEVRLELEDHTVTDAWCVGTMYRGFEQILTGRDPGDALVIAPRICGICSTSQLYAAASALETAYGSPVAPNGTRIRNLCLMAESVMSDARHTFLMFTPDFCNRAYRDHPHYARVMELFEPPFKGRLAARDRRRDEAHPGHRDRLRRPVAALDLHDARRGHMPLDASRLDECSAAIDVYAEWYERAILGCTCEEWLSLQSADDFHAWMEVPAHRESAIGVFTRFGRSIGLHELARGTPHLLSAGCYYDPERWQPPFDERPCLQPGGFYDGDREAIEPFRTEDVAEHLRYAKLVDPAAPGIRGTARPSRMTRKARRTATRRRPATRTTWSSSGRWRTWCWPAIRSSARCSPRTGPRRGYGSSRGCIGRW